MSIINKSERIREGEKKPTRYYSKKQETSVVDNLAGALTKNSGATLFDKGDVKLENFALECKTKTKHSESISIKKEWLDKIDKEAMFMGKNYSALVFNFGPNESNYYIIDELLFKRLIDIVDSKK